MYKYCVQLFPAAMGSFEMRTTGGRFMAMAARHTKNEDTFIDNIVRGQESDIETWYSLEESEAKEIAKHLVAQKPGRQVHIFELKNVASAGIPKISVAAFSDRGLVPI